MVRLARRQAEAPGLEGSVPELQKPGDEITITPGSARSAAPRPPNGILIHATRLEERVSAIAEALRDAGLPGVVVSFSPRTLASLLERALPDHRVLVLDGSLEAAEWDLRLAEVAAGVHGAMVTDSRLLWDSRMVVALTRLGPRLVAIDPREEEGADPDDRLAVALLVGRVRRTFPAARLAVVSAPMSPAARDWVSHIVGSASVPRGGLAPPGIALRAVRVRAERERWGAVLDAASVRGDPLLLVAPSRARAIAAAKRIGSAAMVYHGGLSLGERAAVLEAYRRQPRIMVVTQTLPRTDDLPPPSVIILTHPPQGAETLARLMEWAARSQVPAPLLVIYTDSDLAFLSAGGSRQHPDLADLREVYRAIRKGSRHGYVRTLPDTLAATAGARRWYASLVAGSLNALEAARYLSRGDDISRVVSCTVVTESRRLVERGLPAWDEGAAPPMDPLVAALEQGQDPIEWQRRAAAAALDGLLIYRSAGSERLYRLRAPLRAAAAALEKEVRERAEWAAGEARMVREWLRTPGCRARTLASLMGWPMEDPCGLCDACAPPLEPPIDSGEPWRIALRALAEIPLAVPEGAAERIVSQALKRAGRFGDSKTTKAALDHLLSANLARREQGSLQPRIQISEAGRALLTARGQVGVAPSRHER